MARVFLVLGLVVSVAATAAPTASARVVDAGSFAIQLPQGYADITQEIASAGFPRKQITLQAKAVVKGYQPTIVFQLAPIWGGTLGDLALCRKMAASFAGPTGRIKSVRLIDGPAPSGRVCQLHIVLPTGVALMTELVSSTETWLMTCNHADGDADGERVCRETFAAFKFKNPPCAARPRER
jgi:hypothetical protein